MNLRNVFMTLSILSLTSCTKVVIKDGEWCGDMGSLGASCFHTLSDDSRDIDKDSWDKERFGMVCTQSENFADWKANLLKLCKETKMCSMDVLKKIDAFDGRIKSLVPKEQSRKQLGLDKKSAPISSEPPSPQR